MAKKRTTKKRSVWGNSEPDQQKRARQVLTMAQRSARDLMEFRTPAGILADETDLDPFLQAVEKLAEFFGEPLDMEKLIMQALGVGLGDKRLAELHNQHHDLVLASTLGAFALGVECGRQGGAR